MVRGERKIKRNKRKGKKGVTQNVRMVNPERLKSYMTRHNLLPSMHLLREPGRLATGNKAGRIRDVSVKLDQMIRGMVGETGVMKDQGIEETISHTTGTGDQKIGREIGGLMTGPGTAGRMIEGTPDPMEGQREGQGGILKTRETLVA